MILLTGVSCVGKTTVGRALADSLGVEFADLDKVVESELGAPIPRLQQRFGSMELYRDAVARVLGNLLRSLEDHQAVVALPPSGLMGSCLRRLKAYPVVTVALLDSAENILDRIVFFDGDSQPIRKALTPRERELHLREIRKDIAYFGRSYARADLRVDISGCSVAEAAGRILAALKEAGKLGGPGEIRP